MHRKTIIGIMGNGEGADPNDIKNAYEIGRLIAAQGWILLTGGVEGGIMSAANKGAKENNGITIGIIPRPDSKIAQGVDIPIITDMGSARNNINALTSDVVIACGMGAGTSSEISFALQKRASKPVILINCPKKAEDFFQLLNKELVHIAQTPEEVLALIKKILF